MKILKLIAAAALAVTGVAGSATIANAAPVAVTGASALTISVAASAQRWGHRDNHRYNRGRHYNRGRYYNRGRHHRVCRTVWRHHRRVKVCRIR